MENMPRLLSSLTGNVKKKVNAHDDSDLSALHYAARYNHVLIVQMLVQGGASKWHFYNICKLLNLIWVQCRIHQFCDTRGARRSVQDFELAPHSASPGGGPLWLSTSTQGFLQDFTFWGELKDFGGELKDFGGGSSLEVGGSG